MKLKATTLALFAAGMLTAAVLTAPATGSDAPPATATTTTSPTVYGSASGPIAALSATSITVGDLTCSRNSSSPSLDGFKVGDLVGLGCANGVFVVLADKRTPSTTTTTTTPTAPTTTTSAPQGAGARDPISALSATSITVGPLTCVIGPSSPTVPFKLGERVRIGCLGGVLAYVVADGDAPKPVTTTTTTTTPTAPPVTTTQAEIVTRAGTIAAIGDRWLTVDSLRCELSATSPSIAGFKVGDRVGVACQSNVLLKIVALPNETEPQHDELQTRLGAITALNPTSISVDGLTCSLGSGSPSVAGFGVGDKAGIGCLRGVLVKIGTLQTDDDGFKVSVQLGAIVSLRGDGITVGSLSCKLADTSPSVASFHLGDKVGIGCAGGILFMIGALPNTDQPKAEVKRVLAQHFNGCIKRGAERCFVAGVLRRIAHEK